MNAIVPKQDWGELTPEMRALGNDRQRLYCELYLLELVNNKNKNWHGAQAAAYRKAGYGGKKATPLNIERGASQLMKEEKTVAAIGSLIRRASRVGGGAEA